MGFGVFSGPCYVLSPRITGTGGRTPNPSDCELWSLFVSAAALCFANRLRFAPQRLRGMHRPRSSDIGSDSEGSGWKSAPSTFTSRPLLAVVDFAACHFTSEDRH